MNRTALLCVRVCANDRATMAQFLCANSIVFAFADLGHGHCFRGGLFLFFSPDKQVIIGQCCLLLFPLHWHSNLTLFSV